MSVFKKTNSENVQVNEPVQKFGSSLNFASKEAYNYLKTNLLFSVPKKENEAIVIGITSAIPEDGKSYTSINLSHSFSEDGKKVLLINGDMRKPSIEKSLGIDIGDGLSNILTDFKSPRNIVSVLHENMFVLPSGTCPPNPLKLLSSNELKKLIDELKPNYDYIIFDLPPINSVSDALNISNNLDGIVLVCRHYHTHKKDLREAISKLRFINANILGIVYNSFSNSNSHYYKYKKYRHYNNGYYENNEKENDKNN